MIQTFIVAIQGGKALLTAISNILYVCVCVCGGGGGGGEGGGVDMKILTF